MCGGAPAAPFGAFGVDAYRVPGREEVGNMDWNCTTSVAAIVAPGRVPPFGAR
ncbi:hypothetical protein GCM10010349_01790 [Streptomyces flavofungini]|nr:hypothetical protein GCM10010349_01790 [Streptomyces flavofungini]